MAETSEMIWRDIETAPRSDDEWDARGDQSEGPDVAIENGTEKALFLVWWRPDPEAAGWSTITHWMPLPSPPDPA